MKKILIILLAFLFIFAFTACDDVQPAQKQEADAQQPDSELEQAAEKPEEKEEAADKQESEPEEQVKQEPEQEPEEVKKDWLTVVVAFASHNEEEYEGVINAFEGTEYDVVTVSTSTGEATGDNDGVITIEKTIAEVEDPGLGVIVIGGGGCMVIWDDEDLINLIRQANDDGLLVGAICAANGVLANADVVDGKNACWANYSVLDAMMEDAGCTDSGQSVCVDGNLITGNGPPAAQEFGAAIYDYVSSV